MGTASTLLVRWSLGWIDVYPTTPVSGRRREATLSLGNVGAINEAITAGQRLLEVVGGVRETVALGVIPRTDSTTPYQGWRPAPNTFITAPGWSGPAAQKVASVTVTQDDDGELLYEFDLIDRVTDNEARIQRWLKRMSNGTVGGQSAQASPERPKWSPKPVGRKPTATFMQGGVDDTGALLPVFAGRGPDLPAETRGELREWYIWLTNPGSGATNADLLLDGNVVASATIPAGEFDGRATISGKPIYPNLSRLACRVNYAGSGATGFGGQARVDEIA
jgi:hypothetical protein